ncbi:MAG: hypothetical protein CMI13_05180 [Oleibacter sp.]|nr:hypothetical protein [Thalassolituus sp.]
MVSDSAQDVLDFWFSELKPKQWWVKDTQLDQQIATRFGHVHQQAHNGALKHWRTTPSGRLAEIIVLDQFSRNIFREKPQAFACDEMALLLAREAVEKGADQPLPVQQRAFMYMPFMHSESLDAHKQALTLFAQPGLEANLASEHKHLAILQRFGRYPHRNKILGRESTAEETEFLTQPGSSF